MTEAQPVKGSFRYSTSVRSIGPDPNGEGDASLNTDTIHNNLHSAIRSIRDPRMDREHAHARAAEMQWPRCDYKRTANLNVQQERRERVVNTQQYSYLKKCLCESHTCRCALLYVHEFGSKIQ